MKSLFNSAVPYIVALVLLISTFESLKLYYNEKQTTTRLTDDLAAEQKKGEYFKARNGDQAAKIQSQDLTITELRKISPSIIADLHNLYIAPRQLISYTSAGTETTQHIIATLRDSVIMDTVKVRVLNYDDKWFSVDEIIRGDTAKLDISSCDSIKVVNYMSRRPHPWLWIFGGRRHPESIISNKNPHNTITIEKSIIVKK